MDMADLRCDASHAIFLFVWSVGSGSSYEVDQNNEFASSYHMPMRHIWVLELRSFIPR